MSISKLKLKLKGNLKEKIEKESTRGGSDPRFLPFYDMKDGTKMRVLFVPDVNGELWTKAKKHGPNMKVRGLKAIRCLHDATGEKCPACEKGFDLLNLSKETNDSSYKEEAKKWFARETTYMSVLVLDSPIEIPESPNKNEVKIFAVPFSVEKIIREAITEGQVDESEICSTPFYIKKTTNGGGFADYSSSYFDRRPVTDEEMEFFEHPDIVVEQYDYENFDVVPAAPSSEEMRDWILEASKALSGSEEKEEAPRSQRETPERNQERTSRREEPEMTEEERYMGEGRSQQDRSPEPEEKKETAPSKPSSLRDRLSNLQKK